MLIFITYYLSSPLIFLFLFIASIFNKKIRIIIKEQKKSLKKIKPKLITKKKKIIIHAASAGEYEQIKPLLRIIDRNIYFIIVTCMSPTIYKSIQDDNLSDVYCYHPFDLPWYAKKFLKTIKPSIYLTTRHDVWPIHLYTSKKMKIKTIIINTNLYQKSKRLKWYSINFTKYIFNLFDLIITPSKEVKNIFNEQLQINSTYIISDTRFEQIQHRKKNSHKILELEPIKGKNNIIFGSISWGDLEIFSSLEFENIDIFYGGIIIVPHEINVNLIKKIEERFPNAIRFSNIKDNQYSNIIIVDKVGILPELYKYTKITYVGGGFGKGVHSTIEPLIYNNIVCYGPNIDLLNEAKEMYQKGCGFIINNSTGLIENIVKPQFIYQTGTEEGRTMKKQVEQKIKQYLIEKDSSSKEIYKLINEYT